LVQLDSITQPAISLVELGFNSLERNSLVAALLANVVQGTEEFLQEGFASCKQEWEAVDSMRCREVSVSSEREVLSGIASGVDERGALLLQIGSELRRLNSGELSVRVTSSAVSGQS
jgi:BirA family biotin operon repressor/biotin-[acetyl-CoA-carboxylase] ligase